jgi:4-nitrophenyl phosphatase
MLEHISALIIDMDGVLYRGNSPLPGMKDLFKFMDEKSIRFILATNNATQTPQGFSDKLAKMGVKVDPQLILTSGLAAAKYIQEHYPAGTRVHVFGEDGLKELMSSQGLIVADENVRVVVAGLNRHLNYDNVALASLLIRDGADFIGTNNDATYPSEGKIMPGAGSCIAAIEAASEKQPKYIGKPEPLMYQVAMRMLQVSPENTAALGDRLETDILGGIRAGTKTLLVLTGITTPEMLKVSDIKPDAIFAGLPEMIDAWSAALNR